MALQFILGNSGSGKTHLLHNGILKAAKENPNQFFLMIVPEQFTMQAQRRLVEMHPGHSILNIDVLSFNRLAYRIFDELGGLKSQVLEETGKSLILRRIAQEKGNELTVLKKNITKMGYIGEVKSLISELAQYHVSPSQLSQAIEKLPEGSFSYKLKDVLAMYQGFLDFLEGRFVTAEEILELLAGVADQSAILKNSVIYFDGFTGFTPVQNLLISKLMQTAKDLYVTAAIDAREDFYCCTGSHELFAMSKKMIRSLQEMADRLHILVRDPIVANHTKESRFRASKALFFLEQNLFRNYGKRYALDEENEEVCISSCKNPREELCFAACKIEFYVRKMGYRYRDFAIICGDLPGYANYAREVFYEYRIPVFIDQKVTIAYHPFIEFLRSALEAVRLDFSIESIFRYLRSGLSQIAREDTDLLENYCIAAGVKGYQKWKEMFAYLPRGYEEEPLVKINEIRAEIALQFEGLMEAFHDRNLTVKEQTMAYYQFICGRDIQAQLKQKELAYEAAGDFKNAKEYAQIYKIVMDLFDKVTDLLGNEKIPIEEYARILDAGYEAAKVGIIPPGYDRVVFGDILRTRLDHVKILFLVGANDGVIPKSGGADGILTQAEREQLEGLQLELAPTAREKTFIQKFYLYLTLTKPSEKLYLSYARVDGEGKAIRSAYLVHAILKLYENLKVQEVEGLPFLERILTPENSRELLIEGIESAREWQKKREDAKLRYFAALCRWYGKKEDWKKEMEQLFDAAGLSYRDTPISKAVIRALYGTVLENSVTRLESFASCAFSHFLSYGLKLQERSESGFYAVDIGNLFHEALEHFAEGMKKKQYSWFTVTEEESDALLKEAMEEAFAANHNLALYENARSRYAKERMYRILKRTVGVLLYQVRKGRFTPDCFEVSFSNAKDLKSACFPLSDEETMYLRGRIDRIDTFSENGKRYVKVTDYKSSDTNFMFFNVYYGLQLQLAVYLNAALELMEKRYPEEEIVPAGIFYYHIHDPMIEMEGELGEEERKKKIFGECRLKGLANEERAVVENLDIALQEGGSMVSDVIPVGFNQDGSLKKVSKTLSKEGFASLSSYVREAILHLGQRMMQGEIGISPYLLGDRTGCDYCSFRAVCHFDTKVPGFAYRHLEELSQEEVLNRMKKEERK